MQKPIDSTRRINQLLLRASKSFNTLGEREAAQGGQGWEDKQEKPTGGSSDDEIVWCGRGLWRWMEPDEVIDEETHLWANLIEEKAR